MKAMKAAVLVALTLASVMVLAGSIFVADGQAQTGTDDWKKAIVVPMTGAMEKPDPVDTDANGLSLFWLSEDGTEVCYMVYVANLTDVNQGHIHAVEGENNTGPPVVWLFPEGGTQPMLRSGETDGLLAIGTFTEEDFVGPLEGRSMSDLVNMMENQDAYVNFHTEEYPMGEIRGEFNVNEQDCPTLEQTMMEAFADEARQSPPQAPMPPTMPY